MEEMRSTGGLLAPPTLKGFAIGRQKLYSVTLW